MTRKRRYSMIIRSQLDSKAHVNWVLEPSHGSLIKGKHSNRTTKRIKVQTPPVIGPTPDFIPMWRF